MGNEREFSTDNVIPFPGTNDAETPVVDFSRRAIRHRRLLRIVGFGLLTLLVILPVFILFITGNWFFAALWLLVSFRTGSRIASWGTPRLHCTCPDCGVKMKILLEPSIPDIDEVNNVVCPGCGEAFRFRLVERKDGSSE